MSARTSERYNDFGKTLYINFSYIPETFCGGSVGQYSSQNTSLFKLNGDKYTKMMPILSYTSFQ